MRALLITLLFVFSSPAFAYCLIYKMPGKQYQGYVVNGHGLPYNMEDGMPYAGLLRENVVYKGEGHPVKLGTIDGSSFLDLDGKVAATYADNVVYDVNGKVLGITEERYNEHTNVCDADEALAGVAMFIGIR